MSRKRTQHTKQFKLDAVAYRKEHPDLTQAECAKNLGIGISALARWARKRCSAAIPIVVILMTMPASNLSIP